MVTLMRGKPMTRKRKGVKGREKHPLAKVAEKGGDCFSPVSTVLSEPVSII